ncbi:MAG: rhodanese-related sulfurtransferase [Limisphaerales bacterium]|jgi:rhodanese-related sulfurtransferase
MISRSIFFVLFVMLSSQDVLFGQKTSTGQSDELVKNGVVEQKNYGRMLHNLLSRDVPELSVSDVLDTEMVFLDTREPEEFNVSHIKGARPVGYSKVDWSQIEALPKDTAILVYCSVGYRSEQITNRLIDSGFTNVANLYGGIFEWKNKEREVVDMSAQPTEEVHAFDRIWGVWLRKGKKVYGN